MWFRFALFMLKVANPLSVVTIRQNFLVIKRYQIKYVTLGSKCFGQWRQRQFESWHFSINKPHALFPEICY